MSCLSVFEDPGPARVVANPIFIIPHADEYLPGDELAFEVLLKDADTLKLLVGKPQFFILDAKVSSWGKLGELQACVSVHPGLAYLKARPTLRGVLSIFGEAASKQ